MNVPAGLKYSEEHEWAKLEDENVVVIGVTDFAQCELGDIVFVELPEVGDTLEYKAPFGSVESVKTVSELYAPVSGKVLEVNTALNDAPERINESPYEAGWMIKVQLKDASELDTLWSAEQYIETYSEEA